MRTVCMLLLAVAAGCTSEDTAETEDTEDTEDTEPVGIAPSARCAVEPTAVLRVFGSAVFDGSASDDEDGEITSWTWGWSARPEGSVVELTGTETLVLDPFVPDVAGDYVIGLTVFDDDGLRDTCQATLTAADLADLQVELTWTEAGDDLDLHLIRGGALPADPQDDCFYLNCQGPSSALDWGDPGPDDDPMLVQDDTAGTGPEVISYPNPLPEQFRVVVHDYNTPAGDYPGNLATVNVTVGGLSVFSDTRSVGAEDSYQEFAYIDWELGQFYGL